MDILKAEIIPTEGIILDGKRVSFGATENEIREMFGEGMSVRGSLYYFSSELRFDFDSNGRLEFIEFSGGIEGKIKPNIYGISVFDTLEDIVYCTLLEKNGKENVYDENGYFYAFKNISVGLYREIKPWDLEENLREMKKNGIPFESYADLEKDKQTALHWPVIGSGKKGYYNL